MAKIKIGALGGLGENGKNMTIVEVDEHIFILDCGIKYPEIEAQLAQYKEAMKAKINADDKALQELL